VQIHICVSRWLFVTNISSGNASNLCMCASMHTHTYKYIVCACACACVHTHVCVLRSFLVTRIWKIPKASASVHIYTQYIHCVCLCVCLCAHIRCCVQITLCCKHPEMSAAPVYIVCVHSYNNDITRSYNHDISIGQNQQLPYILYAYTIITMTICAVIIMILCTLVIMTIAFDNTSTSCIYCIHAPLHQRQSALL